MDNKNRESACRSVAHVAALRVMHPHELLQPERNAAILCARLFRTAGLLAKDSFLGGQFLTAKCVQPVLHAFTDVGAPVTEEDLAWVFAPCTEGSVEDRPLPEDFFAEGRKLYALSALPDSCETPNGYVARMAYDPEEDTCSASELRETFEALGDVDASIRVLVFGDGKGSVLFSLPQEMPLRLRVLLSLAFPGTSVTALPESDEAAALPNATLENVVFGLILGLMNCRTSEAAFDETFCTFDSPKDEAANLPAESRPSSEQKDEDIDLRPLSDLELSIRAFNCLRRVGIETVGELRKLSEEDLKGIRNLGPKCIREIQTLLEALPGSTPAPKEVVHYTEQLGALIGLEDVKAQVQRITAFAKMKQDLKAREQPAVPVVLNMEFVGNPGTAKTTVARILAGIFHEIGLLPSATPVEVGRADLIAHYVGQTADKVRDVFRSAKGKVLFIDEAYSLLDGCKGEFGDEAINTIVQEMENNRDHTVVIFSGYPDEMEKFFARNPGLRSRVPFQICFRDYSTEELVQIAAREASLRGFSISPNGEEAVRRLCAASVRRPVAGNGRYCRNMVEKAILNYAERVYGNSAEAAEKNFVLTERDFVLPQPPSFAGKAAPIGFR